MQKSRKSRMRDAEKKRNKIWYRDPQLNVRQASGVRFGGEYITKLEYIKRKTRRALLG